MGSCRELGETGLKEGDLVLVIYHSTYGPKEVQTRQFLALIKLD